MKGESAVVLCSNAENLRKFLDSAEVPTGTVEAEYGEEVVEGSAWTLAHHGARSGNPAPCLADPADLTVVGLIGLSHVDLDSLMGVGIAMGRLYQAAFADLAAHVDTKGPHRGPEHEGWVKYAPNLRAFWAWSAQNRLFPPRDGSVEDVTEFVENALGVLDRVLSGDEELLAAGAAFAAAEDELNESSFLRCEGGVAVRSSDGFVNHLYRTPSGEVARFVVALNRERHSVTVSAADGGLNCREVVQSLWGPEAGGHAGIAGSPRDAEFGVAELNDAVAAVLAATA